MRSLPKKSSSTVGIKERIPGSRPKKPQRQQRAQTRTRDPRITDTTNAKRPLPLGPALRTQQAQKLSKRINAHLDRSRIHLTITNNRAVMISVKRDARRRQYNVRLHHLFVDAPKQMIEHLARYISLNDSASSKVLGDYIEENQERILPQRRRVKRAAAINTRGRTYDLQLIFDQLNRKYFKGKVDARITWGRNTCRGKARRSIKVGSFELEENLIRVHPGLDQEWVPNYYIQWVVYHEMLHAVHPIPLVNGRRRFHTADFIRDEHRFANYDRAVAWEKQNIAALFCI